MFAFPMRSAEHPAQDVMQVVAGIGQGVDLVHRRTVRRWQLSSLRVVEAAPDVAPGDQLRLISSDEPEAVVSADHDPVEDV